MQGYHWILFVWLSTVFALDDDDVPTKFILQHSFDSGPTPVYTERGTLTIKSLNSGTATISSKPLSAKNLESLKNLAASDGFYRVRLVLADPEKRSGSEYVSSVMKACTLLESGLSEILTLSLDQSGRVIGLAATPAYPVFCPPTPRQPQTTHFNTTVFVALSTAAPQPDTAGYLQKVQREKEAQAKRSKEDERGFFAKYWMYIVPVVIIMMISNSVDQGQGGGR